MRVDYFENFLYKRNIVLFDRINFVSEGIALFEHG
jgi:hypothetical protein